VRENQGLAPDLAGNLQRTDPQSTKKNPLTQPRMRRDKVTLEKL